MFGKERIEKLEQRLNDHYSEIANLTERLTAHRKEISEQGAQIATLKKLLKYEERGGASDGFYFYHTLGGPIRMGDQEPHTQEIDLGKGVKRTLRKEDAKDVVEDVEEKPAKKGKR